MKLEPIRQTDHGIEIALKVRPGAQRSGIAGTHDNRIKVAVNAPPEDGKANRAVVKLIANRLGIATANVEVVRGITSRSKTVRVTGATMSEISQRLLP